MSASALDGNEIPYDKMEWVWISNHYDIHLDGLCRFNGELARFETWNADENPVCKIFQLTISEKARWLFRKWAFELCIGRHWTYPDRVDGASFHMEGWFGKSMFNIYYWLKKTK